MLPGVLPPSLRRLGSALLQMYSLPARCSPYRTYGATSRRVWKRSRTPGVGQPEVEASTEATSRASMETPTPGGPALCGPGRSSQRFCSAAERLTRLEQRLEAGEDVHPAGAGDAGRRLRRVLEPVVDD